MHDVDLLLVNPGNRSQMYGKMELQLPGVEPPLLTGLIASFIRDKGFSTEIIDADAQGWEPEYTAQIIAGYKPLVTGIGILGPNPSVSSTPKMAAASDILNALKVKRVETKTFVYGIHPSALPERTLRDEAVDFVCKGEPFYTISELLETLKSGKDPNDFKIEGLWYLKNGRLVTRGYGKIVKDIDELPFVAWDLLPMDRYRAHNWHCFGHINQRQPYAVIYTSLGCPFNCAYCNIHAIYTGKPHIRFRSSHNVIEEIDLLVDRYKVKNIKILDELFVFKQERVIELCDLIIGRGYNLNIWAYARIDTVNENLLKKMKQAGINWLAYGIESANKKVRDGVAKGAFGQKAIRRAVEMSRNAGINIIANFIFGLPDDDRQTMRETLDMAKEFDFEYVNFYVAMAYPGSRLYEEAIKNGVELPRAWLGYSQFNEETFPLRTKYLSGAEVLRFRDEAFQEYFSNPEYLDMIKNKFGVDTVRHIEEMLQYKIRRKLLERENIDEEIKL